MSIRKRIQILAVEEKKSKAGNPYFVAECVVYGEQIRVGQMMVFGDIAKTVCPGEFYATYEVAVNYERQITAELVRLEPVAEVMAKEKKS